MIKILKNSTTFAYADDTAVIVSHESMDTATQIMQNELNIMTRWCHDNGLIINATKTKIMHFRPRQHLTDISPHPMLAQTSINNIDDTCSTC